MVYITIKLDSYYLFTGFIDEEAMTIMEEILQAITIGLIVAYFLLNTGRAPKAIEVCKECLIILNNAVLQKQEQFVNLIKIRIYVAILMASLLVADYTSVISYGWKLLDIYRERGETAKEGTLTLTLADICEQQCKNAEARKLYERLINIVKETGDRKGEAYAYGKFGSISYRLCEYDKAKEYLKKALSITIEIGDRAGVAAAYGNLGTVFQSLGEHGKAKEHLEKGLAISIDLGVRSEEASSYGNLAVVFQSLGEYDKAEQYHEKALAIRKEIGDREGEAADYGNLGTLFQSLGKNGKANEYLKKALAIRIEIGDREGEANCYGNLGAGLRSVGKYDEAKEYLDKALEIRIEIGDKAGEASCYGNLGAVYRSLGKYEKAIEYIKKALTIRIDIGQREEEASSYGDLGTVFLSLGEYEKAKKYIEKALAIKRETGHKEGEASCYGNLGNLFRSLGEYDKAKEYFKKALEIKTEIGDRQGEAIDYGNLGTLFQTLGKDQECAECLDRALAIQIEVGDRNGEANCYGNLGTVSLSLGEYDKAKAYFERALAIRIEIGDIQGKAVDLLNLGTLFHSYGEHVKAEDYFEEALSITREIGDLVGEIECLGKLSLVKLCQDKIQEALDCLVLSMYKSENLRSFLGDNDQFKISFSDVRKFPYRNLSAFFCFCSKTNQALYVLELARARALADLMASQYSVESQISADPRSWIGIENIMKKESNCTCLYISCYRQHLFLWTLTTSGVIRFRRKTVDEDIEGAGSSDSSGNVFGTKFRSFDILPEEDCEDRSFDDNEPNPDFSQEEELATLRQVKGKDDPEQNLTLFYKMIIAPVADLLEGSEIIIVPDPCLYHVPFPALVNDNGKYLSETFRIRIIPSLTTLKCIQDSATDHHSQSGALIVGDPEVGEVRFKRRRKTFTPLPFARREAEMIGHLLGVQPLLGEEATKQAVRERLHSAGLIHFAAHGDAEKGEIALSPVRSTGKLPKEQDYLLTMSDISEVQLRAKLVVLSCCHSARGHIRTEGVVGMARAFLGSGARSVLVALWALDDKATEKFMSRFYEHLFRGESASESLHQAMKWMRGNGWSEVRQWAPFMLIGDNVSFEFGK